MAVILNGKILAQRTLNSLKEIISKLPYAPGLGVIIVGEDPSSVLYVKKKQEACDYVGIEFKKIQLPLTSSEKEIISAINEFNGDPKINGFIIQLPLPDHIDSSKIVEQINSSKDADGLCPENIGLLAYGKERIVAATPKGIMRLIKEYDLDLNEKIVAVVGSSPEVGKPLVFLLEQKGATVILCHTKTSSLPDLIKQSDIVISATGKPHLIKKDMIKDNSVVIDVGNCKSKEGKIIGDVDFEHVSEVAGYITPVPGGVGPMTVAMLLENVLECYKLQTTNFIKSEKIMVKWT